MVLEQQRIESSKLVNFAKLALSGQKDRVNFLLVAYVVADIWLQMYTVLKANNGESLNKSIIEHVHSSYSRSQNKTFVPRPTLETSSRGWSGLPLSTRKICREKPGYSGSDKLAGSSKHM